jgi:hypothetical protein
MWGAAADLAAGIESTAMGLVDSMAGAAVAWLALGVALHLTNQIARGRAWYAVVRRACPDDHDLRARHVLPIWVAGAGAGGVVSARGGDALRIVLMNRRLPDRGPALLAGTIVAEGVGDTVIGIVLLAAALAAGVGPRVGIDGHALPWLLAGAAVLVIAVLLLRRWAPARKVGSGIGRGCAALEAPGAYAKTVIPWQIASRLARAGALACFLLAFHLPATPAAVLLVMVAQAGGRLVPLAPVSVGASVGMLAASFGTVTGTSASTESLAAFFLGTSTVLTIAGIALTAAIVLKSTPVRFGKPHPIPR